MRNVIRQNEKFHCRWAAWRRARSTSSLQPPASSLIPAASRRRGISLLEVLISMFVMLFGLMGVAAIFPVGNHYAVRGEQFDRGSALATGAFAELKSRGMLRPARPLADGSYLGLWQYPDNQYVIDPANGQFAATTPNAPALAYVIDPIGAADSALNDRANNFFPYGGGIDSETNPWQNSSAATPWLGYNTWPIRRITLPGWDRNKMTARMAEAICQLRDDLVVELPDSGDRPGVQRWSTYDANNTPRIAYDDTPLARAYNGSSSWLATLLPVNEDALQGLQPSAPRHGSHLYELSVAVFYKRNLPTGGENERGVQAELHPGGELLLYLNHTNEDDDIELLDAALEDMRPGNWMALAGVHPVSGKFLLKWYRILSMDKDTIDSSGGAYNAQRHVMIDGPDWPPPPAGQPAVTNLRAILLPGIVGVATQTVNLERE